MQPFLKTLLHLHSNEDVEKILLILSKISDNVHYVHVNNTSAFKDVLENQNFNLVISNYASNCSDSIHLRKTLRDLNASIPLIAVHDTLDAVVSDQLDSEKYEECIDFIQLPAIIDRLMNNNAAFPEHTLIKNTLSLNQQSTDKTTGVVIVVSRKGQILKVNEAATELYGYSKEEFYARTIFDLSGSSEKLINKDTYDFNLSIDTLIETTHYKKNGAPINVEMSGSWMTIEDNDVQINAIREITKNNQIEETLLFLSKYGYSEDDEDFFQALAKFISQKIGMDYVCIDRLYGDNLSAQTLAIYYDGHFEDNVSYALEDTPCGTLMGKRLCTYTKNVRALFPKDEVLQEMVAESYVGTTLFSKNGTPIGLIATISRAVLKDPKMAEILLEIVTSRASGELERRINEEELVRSKEDSESANLAKSQFLENMSHEIRTPMNGIMGMMQLVLMTDLSTDQKEYLRIALDSSNALLKLINDILDYSKVEAGKVILECLFFRMDQLIHDLVTLFEPTAQSKGLKLTYNMALDLSTYYYGDPFKLRQILSNLLSNAIKFTKTGSVELKVNTLQQNDDKSIKLKFEVKDTGIGITKHQSSLLFKRFQQANSSITREYGGTGLGLAITKKLVDLMNGTIELSSNTDGTIVAFTCVLSTLPSDAI